MQIEIQIEIQIGLILQYIALIVVPGWVLFDSKKRTGRYSWIIALLIAIGLAALVRQTLFDLETKWMKEMLASDSGGAAFVILGKTVAAYLIPVVVYRIMVPKPNEPAKIRGDESKQS